MIEPAAAVHGTQHVFTVLNRDTTWATIERVVTAIAAAASSAAALLGARNRRKLDEVHGAVNGNLSSTIEQVEQANRRLGSALADAARLRADLSQLGKRSTDVAPPATIQVTTPTTGEIDAAVGHKPQETK